MPGWRAPVLVLCAGCERGGDIATAMRFIISNDNDLAVRAFETGCRRWAPVLAEVLVLGAVS